MQAIVLNLLSTLRIILFVSIEVISSKEIFIILVFVKKLKIIMYRGETEHRTIAPAED